MKVSFVVLCVASCAPSPSAHAIEPVRPGETTETHWPDASHGVVATLKTFHAAVQAWRAANPNECPTLERLKDERTLAASSITNDAWGTPYKVMCDEDESHIVSFGADRREGTADDIQYP
jgi:hypothetical protein